MNHTYSPDYFPRLWVGVTGLIVKDKWMFDSNLTAQQEANFDEMIFGWKQGQPDNYEGKESCVNVMRSHGLEGSLELNDVSCDFQVKPIHGLCEIKVVGWYNEK